MGNVNIPLQCKGLFFQYSGEYEVPFFCGFRSRNILHDSKSLYNSKFALLLPVITHCHMSSIIYQFLHLFLYELISLTILSTGIYIVYQFSYFSCLTMNRVRPAEDLKVYLLHTYISISLTQHLITLILKIVHSSL